MTGHLIEQQFHTKSFERNALIADRKVSQSLATDQQDAQTAVERDRSVAERLVSFFDAMRGFVPSDRVPASHS